MKGYNFLISNPFLMILSASDAPKGGIQACLDPKATKLSPWIRPALSA